MVPSNEREVAEPSNDYRHKGLLSKQAKIAVKGVEHHKTTDNLHCRAG